jgi:hypothetical protein
MCNQFSSMVQSKKENSLTYRDFVLAPASVVTNVESPGTK